MGIVLRPRGASARTRAARGLGALVFTPDDQLAAAQASGDDADATRRRRNQEAYDTIKKYGEAIGTVFPAAAGFVAVALLCFKGAMRLSDLVTEDQNSAEDKRRVADALARFSEIQIVPQAFDGYSLGAKGYADKLEASLSGFDALPTEEKAQVRAVGSWFGRHGDQPVLFEQVDALARGRGMVWGTYDYSENYPSAYPIARVIGTAAAIEWNAIDGESMDAVVAAAQLAWHESMREQKAAGADMDATRSHWHAIAAAGVAAAAKASELGTPRPLTMAGRSGVVSAFQLARDAGLVDTVRTRPSPPPSAAPVVVGGAVVVGAGLFLFRTAAGAAIRRAFGL